PCFNTQRKIFFLHLQIVVAVIIRTQIIRNCPRRCRRAARPLPPPWARSGAGTAGRGSWYRRSRCSSTRRSAPPWSPRSKRRKRSWRTKSSSHPPSCWTTPSSARPAKRQTLPPPHLLLWSPASQPPPMMMWTQPSPMRLLLSPRPEPPPPPLLLE
ncbi:unnamed protein product, partial [Ectocarpus sp. 6 AP-2014]